MKLGVGGNRRLTSLVGSVSKTPTFSEFPFGAFPLIRARIIHSPVPQNLGHQGAVKTHTQVPLTMYKGRSLTESHS